MLSTLNFIDILLLLGISQGVFLTITLPIVHRSNTKPNFILSANLGMISILLFFKLALTRATELWMIQWFSIAEFIVFLFGPLGYIYIRRLLIIGEQNFKLAWGHYIPAVLYGLFLLHLCSYSEIEYKNFYEGGYLKIIYAIIEGLALFSNLYYLFLSARLAFYFEKERKQQLSFSQPSLSFIKVMLSLMAIVVVLWCFSYFNSTFFGVHNPYINYNTIWIGLPLLIYCIGFYALKQPEIFRVKLANKNKEFVSKKRLNEIDIHELKKQLENIINKEKLYLNNELTLTDLSKRLNTSTNNLSWLLNNVFKSNFYDYINKYRVSAFLEKINNKEHENQTLLALSIEVGFKSKSTFNKAFKTVIKDTPSNYIKSIHT